MSKLHSYFKTIGNSISQESDSELWDKAINLFEEKKYLDSFYTTLSYLDKNILERFSNEEKTSFSIPQGSIIINVNIANGFIEFSAPFVKIPETKYMPILRRCIGLNFTVMTLPQIIIKEDELSFQYKTPIELVAPYKVYCVLRDIAHNADKYDDEFVEKYDAKRIHEANIKPIEKEKLEICLANIKTIAKESLEKSAHYENKRRFHNALDALYIGLKQIDYYCEPSGTFSNKLYDAVSNMFNRDLDMTAKAKLGKQFLTDIENLTLENLEDTVFYNYCLISLKKNMTRKGLKNWIENLFDQTVEYYEKDDYISAGYHGMYTFYTLLADFKLDNQTQKSLEYVLEITANKEFTEEVCEEYLDLMEFFIENVEGEYPKVSESNLANVNFSNEIENAMDQYKNMMGQFMNMFNKK